MGHVMKLELHNGEDYGKVKLYKKEGNTVQIVCLPTEQFEKGDYLIVEDRKAGKALLVQIVDIQFANIPGILEEILRECSQEQEYIEGEEIDPLEVLSQITLIQDARVLICKIRAAIENGKLTSNTSWLPSRISSTIRKIPVSKLFSLAGINGKFPIYLGETKEKSQLFIDAQSLDGRLNIITGKKETGKSHLSKLLVLSLIHYGATVIVLDLNGEYTGLGYDGNGNPNEYCNKIKVLTPGRNFKITLKQIDLKVMLNILLNALKLPGTSAREFRRIWRFLKERDMLSMKELGEAIRNWKCNQHIRDALFSRYYALLNSGFFTDNLDEACSLEEILEEIKFNGGALIINMQDISTIDRQMVVEFVLGKLVELLANWRLRSVFLFAEEAHLYLRDTYWDDIVTRMRHYGVFTTFITNQPDSIRESIYRQADNIFLFNFT
ncbi:MAG TPA: DUF87 domain-containing protein, partial [Candidatus Bathyarchaeota archaeon]|nr:DUF87 domain-containing protein [Candidatus Bathyarchaeota archaeon]HEX68825.1 DUF87 domain-containing protein [Candidatus Bathyarchaeota archaeon]